MKNKDRHALDVVETTGFKLIGGIESMEINLSPKEMIVEEIIGEHKIIALSADTNVGKSIWAHQLGLAIAVGKSEIFDFQIAKPNRVLFLNFDMDEEELIKPKNNIELGGNLDTLSVDELLEYIEELKIEIERAEKIKTQKYNALDLAKKFFNITHNKK